MDKSALSKHTPETKKQSKQRLKKGVPGPVKPKVHAWRIKLMVITFFDSQVTILSNYIFAGQTVNSIWLVKALQGSSGNCERKGLSSSSVFLHLDNAPMHSVKLMQEYLMKRGVQVLEHAPYSPNLAPVDFSMFPKL
jgi:[histone H3]-lysine36 N-dimethyltransferase SETMAR